MTEGCHKKTRFNQNTNRICLTGVHSSPDIDSVLETSSYRQWSRTETVVMLFLYVLNYLDIKQ